MSELKKSSRLLVNHPLLKILNYLGRIYPVPVSITYLWNFGFLSLICLIIQIITGIFLACIILVMLI